MQLAGTRGALDDLGVMAGRHGIESQRQRLVQQRGELDLLVAAQTGVGRAARGVLGDEILNDVVVEPGSHVPDVEGNPDHVSHPAGITSVLNGATATRALAQGGGVPAQREMDSDHLVPGLDHARGGNGRVDAAAHGGHDPHQDVCLGLAGFGLVAT